MAARLARIPAAVWGLPIAWRRYAADLDRAAAVPLIPVEASREARVHAQIASHLKSAARLLCTDPEEDAALDPALDTMLWAVWSRQPERYPWWRRTDLNSHPELAPQKTARLSDFLRLAAVIVDGEHGWFQGIHPARGVPGFSGTPNEAQQAGANPAAMVAFERVSRFVRHHTKRAHDELVAEIVIAYHPDAADRREAWARSARLKIGKHG